MLIEQTVPAYSMPSLILGTVLNDSTVTSVDAGGGGKTSFLNCIALKSRINSKINF